MKLRLLALVLTSLALPGCRLADERFWTFPLNARVYEALRRDAARSPRDEARELERDAGLDGAGAIGLVLFHTLIPIGWAGAAVDVALPPVTLSHDNEGRAPRPVSREL